MIRITITEAKSLYDVRVAKWREDLILLKKALQLLEMMMNCSMLLSVSSLPRRNFFSYIMKWRFFWETLIDFKIADAAAPSTIKVFGILSNFKCIDICFFKTVFFKYFYFWVFWKDSILQDPNAPCPIALIVNLLFSYSAKRGIIMFLMTLGDLTMDAVLSVILILILRLPFILNSILNHISHTFFFQKYRKLDNLTRAKI